VTLIPHPDYSWVTRGSKQVQKRAGSVTRLAYFLEIKDLSRTSSLIDMSKIFPFSYPADRNSLTSE
jgi:hypothetical protein